MKKLALGVATALLLAACSGDPAPRAIDQQESSPRADDSILQQIGSGDFPSAASPGKVAVQEDYVVVGTIDGVEDGRSESVSLSDGTTETDRYFVIRIKVDELVKGEPELFKDGYAYVTRPRGVQTYDAEGNLIDGGDAAMPLEEITEALPTGSRVVAMGSADPSTMANARGVINPRAGVPNSQAPVLNVYNPQKLLLDGGPESTLRGWQNKPNLTFDVALREIRAAAK